MQLLLATNNKAKVARIRFLLAGVVECFTLADKGIESVDPEEGSDIIENAKAKALAHKGMTNIPILGMDSAFVIDGENADPARVRRNALEGKDESSLTPEEIARAMVEHYQEIAKKHGGLARAAWENAYVVVMPDGTVKSAKGVRPVILTMDSVGPLDIHFPLRTMYISEATGKRPLEETPEDERLELAPDRAALKEILGV